MWKKEIKVDDTDRAADFKDEIKYEIGVQEKIYDVQTKITPVKNWNVIAYSHSYHETAT